MACHLKGLPDSGELICQDDAEGTGAFLDTLRAALEEFPPGTIRFESVDISKSRWSSISLDCLFSILAEKAVSINKLKAFKCGITDADFLVMTGFLKEMPHNALPSELHLSHNKLTREAVESLLQMLEEKRAEIEAAERMPPIWLRVEGNALQDPEICDLVFSGRAIFVERVHSAERNSADVAVCVPAFHQPGHQNNKGFGGKGCKGGKGEVWMPGKGGCWGKGGMPEMPGKGGCWGKGGMPEWGAGPQWMAQQAPAQPYRTVPPPGKGAAQAAGGNGGAQALIRPVDQFRAAGAPGGAKGFGAGAARQGLGPYVPGAKGAPGGGKAKALMNRSAMGVSPTALGKGKVGKFPPAAPQGGLGEGSDDPFAELDYVQA